MPNKLHKHIILIGFPCSGKSHIGAILADKLCVGFVDLDHKLTELHTEQTNNNHSCRDIMNFYGEAYFRQLETRTLTKVMQQSPHIIALGGGSVMAQANRDLIKDSCIVHITADKAILQQRLLSSGIPAYFNKDKSIKQNIEELLDERTTTYQSLASLSCDNSGDIGDTLDNLINNINMMELAHD